MNGPSEWPQFLFAIIKSVAAVSEELTKSSAAEAVHQSVLHNQITKLFHIPGLCEVTG